MPRESCLCAGGGRTARQPGGYLAQPPVRASHLTALLIALAASPTRSLGQVPLGHAVVVGAGATTAPRLWLFEPLNLGLLPLDASTLPAQFQVSAVHVLRGGARLLLAGALPTVADDVVLLTTLNGRALGPPQPFAQGLAGRVVSLFQVPASGEVVVVTQQAMFAVPITGGTARPLTPTTPGLAIDDVVFSPPSTVLAAAVDNAGQAIVWRLDLITSQLGSLPLRLSGHVAIASGPQPASILVAERTGQLWIVDLTSLARTSWLNVGRSPLSDLWDYDDQHAWFGAVGTDIVRIDRQGVGSPLPVPPAGARDLTYRAYESAVTAYGAACRGSASRLADVGWQGRPVPGNDTFAFTVGNARASTPAAMMVGAVATNIPLDVFGMPTCVLLTQPLVSIPASTTATGFAQVPFAIPPDPLLAGVTLYVQWLILDPGTNVASLVVSNGARVEI